MDRDVDKLSDRFLEFAARAGVVVDALPDTRLGRHIAGQLVRCGTSSGANYEEARAAESKADFVHKLAICLKELRETRYWIRLAAKAKLIVPERLDEIADECEQLCRITAKSILTAKGK
ncbi:MAG: four helix bundle protein [Phycisphaeraceae bacterium]